MLAIQEALEADPGLPGLDVLGLFAKALYGPEEAGPSLAAAEA